MGDRANIVMHSKEGRIYFYTHWSGYSLPSILSRALDRGRDRWTDSPYLSRIIFCEMIAGSEYENTGFGISATLTDSEHPLLIVNTDNATVSIEGCPEKSRIKNKPCIGKSFSFQEFVALSLDLETGWSVLNNKLIEA